MEMPFGKYKGQSVNCLPNSYIKWLVENVELRGKLKDEVCKIYNSSAFQQYLYLGYEELDGDQSWEFESYYASDDIPF